MCLDPATSQHQILGDPSLNQTHKPQAESPNMQSGNGTLSPCPASHRGKPVPSVAAGFDGINVDELTQLTMEIRDPHHCNHQQQLLFQRAFQRLVTELERMYKHQLFNILQELGVISHLVHGEEMNRKSLQVDDNIRKKLAQLQAYTKKNCDALIEAVTNHDSIFGTALKQSLLPVLVTAKCFEDGVINRLLHFSRPQLELGTTESQFEDHTPPGLASDWSLSTNSTPGCSSPAPKSDSSCSGLVGPPPAKRAKLSPQRDLPEFEKLLPPKLPQNDRATPIKMEDQQASASYPKTNKMADGSSYNNEIPSAFRYLGKQGSRSNLFRTTNKLPDHGLQLSHKGIYIENSFIPNKGVQAPGVAGSSFPVPDLLANNQVTTPVSQLMSQTYNLQPATQTLRPLQMAHQTSNGYHAVAGNNGTLTSNIQIPFQTVPPAVSSMSQYVLPSHTLMGQDVYDPLLNIDNHVSMSMDLMASVAAGWKHSRAANHSLGKRKKKFKGIRKTASGKWVARIEHNGKQKHLGTFPTLEEAATTYDQALYQILSITRPKKINLKRFNFPDNICSTYGIAENGVLRVCKKEIDHSVVRSMSHGHHQMPLMPQGSPLEHHCS